MIFSKLCKKWRKKEKEEISMASSPCTHGSPLHHASCAIKLNKKWNYVTAAKKIIQ